MYDVVWRDTPRLLVHKGTDGVTIRKAYIIGARGNGMARQAKTVGKEGDEYVARGPGGGVLARAGALNLYGERAAMSPGSEITFSNLRSWQAVGNRHKNGVLYIE